MRITEASREGGPGHGLGRAPGSGAPTDGWSREGGVGRFREEGGKNSMGEKEGMKSAGPGPETGQSWVLNPLSHKGSSTDLRLLEPQVRREGAVFSGSDCFRFPPPGLLQWELPVVFRLVIGRGGV